MNRMFVAVIAVLTILIAIPLCANFASAVDPVGCCVPKNSTVSCFSAAGNFITQPEFDSACIALPGQKKNVATCNGLSECTTGCCCADAATVPNAATFNSLETNLNMTQGACAAKPWSGEQGTYTFTKTIPTDPTKDTCVEVCKGSSGGGSAKYKVSGVVHNATNTAKPGLKNVTVYIPVINGFISSISDGQGKFVLNDVPSMIKPIYAIHPACMPYVSQPYTVDKDITNVNIDMNCDLKACSRIKPTIENLALIAGTDKASFTAKYDDKCKDFVRFIVKRCDKDFKNCGMRGQMTDPDVTAAKKEATFTDSGLTNNTKHCYLVDVETFTGYIEMNGSADGGKCIDEGDKICMTLPADHPTSWCGTNDARKPTILSCDDKNKLDKTSHVCNDKEVCTVDTDGPVCIPMEDCRKCNGILGFFAGFVRAIGVGDFMKTCGSQTPTCYIDTRDGDASTARAKTMNVYTSCANVTGCTTYGSKNVCDNNVCTTGAGSCQWKEISKELSAGICISKENPECSACNTVFGYCNKAACTAISPDCYYDQDKGAFAYNLGCVNKNEMACAFYDTKTDCVGSGANEKSAIYNITYTQDNRTGGTNSRIRPSNDILGIGACVWLDAEAICVKNTDNHYFKTPRVDDCSDYLANPPISCFKDSTPPNTSIELLNKPYSRAQIRGLPFIVIDEGSALDTLKTFACFNITDNNCYPREELRKLSINSIPPAGTFTLRYYSMDKGGNIEEIKSTVITVVDTGEPILELPIDIQENP